MLNNSRPGEKNTYTNAMDKKNCHQRPVGKHLVKGLCHANIDITVRGLRTLVHQNIPQVSQSQVRVIE